MSSLRVVRECATRRNTLTHVDSLLQHASSQRINISSPVPPSPTVQRRRGQATICRVDCGAPVPCLPIGGCRCGGETCNWALDFAQKGHELLGIEKMGERVQKVSWDDVVLPSARRLFSLGETALPAGAVLDLPDALDLHASQERCTNVSLHGVQERERRGG